jgi:NAD(P)-dependent dehydrogenase (short-subunit alcohol dehydrogenase family)
MPEDYILVTGTTRGIGAAIAQELAATGFKVAGLTRSGKTAAGDGFVCDVTDEKSVAGAVAAVAERGPIAGLVNNAGLFEVHRSDKLSAADFERIMRINATSVLVASREVYPHLKRAGGGLIVNIGSYYDKLGVHRTVAYCASKAAVGAITRCLAVEWARDNIRWSMWHPATSPPTSMPSIGRGRGCNAGSSSAFPLPARDSRRRWRGWCAPCSRPASHS